MVFAKDFAGACDVLVVHSFMPKGTLVAVVGFLSFCVSLSAQQSDTLALENLRGSGIAGPRSAVGHDFFALNNSALFRGFPAPTLLDGRLVSFSTALNWMQPVEFLPALSAVEPRRASFYEQRARNLSDRLTDLQPKIGYATGEVGFLYGTWTGRSNGEFKQGYIIGEVGNENTRITVGAAYEDSSWRIPRQRR
jgi:hypothetical protein